MALDLTLTYFTQCISGSGDSQLKLSTVLSIATLRHVIVFACMMCTAAVASFAQQALPPQVQAELLRRGVAEADLRERLTESGINPDNLTEEQVILLRPEIERIVNQLESEAQQAAKPTVAELPANSQQPTTNGGVASPAGASGPGAATALPPKSGNPPGLGGAIPSTPNPVVPPTPPSQNPIYGHEIFRNGALEVFNGEGNADAPENYQIGVGDELSITIFGLSQIDLLLRVDELGFITPPRLPKIYVRGLNLGQARNLVRSRLRQSYLFEEGQFSMGVNGLRTLRINVFGEVERSGTYAMSALNGALNAVVAAGGPNERGSVRRIQRNRGESSTRIDVYKYLSDPSKVAADLGLQNGDVVFVPIATRIVTLQGAVRRPMRYELLQDEGLTQLIDFAGGLSADAFSTLVQVRRLVNGRAATIDVDLTSLTSSQGFELQDADVVDVRRLSQPERQSIVVRGAVELPGDFAYRNDLRVSEVVREARLRRGARTDVAFVRRTNADSSLTLLEVSIDEALRGGAADLLLRQNDTVEILSQNVYTDKATIAVTGAVRRQLPSFPYSRDSTITVTGALLLAGGLSPNASKEGLLFRRDANNRKVTRYQMVNLQSDADVVRLNPFDSLVVFPRELFTDAFQVEIKGAVRRPGKYIYNPTLGIKELFTLAGGFRTEAALNRIEVFRLEFSENLSTETRLGTLSMNRDYEVVNGDIDLSILQPYDVIAVRSAPEFEITKQVNVDGEVRYPGSYPLNRTIRTLGDLIASAGGITDEGFASAATLYREQGNVGYIILELDDVMVNLSSPNNIVLLEGDMLYIPKAVEIVGIRALGTRARKNYVDTLLSAGEISIAFQGPKSAKWYIEEFAGGFDKGAMKRTVTVRDPSGRIRRTKRFGIFRNYPLVSAGSTIAMQVKPKKIPKSRDERVDWAGIAGTVTTALTAGLSVVLIINTIRNNP